MKFADTFKVTTPFDCEVVVTRTFDAPRKLIFDALTKPECVKRWLPGPPGWSMPIREIDLRIGGATATSGALTVLYESKEARDTATRSGMEQGMAAGYNNLEELQSAFQAEGA